MNVDMAERLAKRRRKAGLSQEALAEQLGVSRQAVSKWERSESSPDTDNLIALAKLYDVSLDDLLYAEPEDAKAAKNAAKAKGSDSAESGSKGTGSEPADAETAPADAEVEPEPAQAASDRTDPDQPQPGQPGSDQPQPDKNVRIGPDGFFAHDGKDHVHISWRDGVHVVDGKRGDTVHVGWGGVRVNDRTYDSIKDLHDDLPHFGHCRTKPARSRRWRAWMRFPFPVVALLAYLIGGLTWGQWLTGFFLIFAIPLYYVIGTFIGTRSVSALLGGLYAIGTLAWFCYMAFVLNQPHPAWVALLTIPLVCSLLAWVAHARRKRCLS